MSLGNQSLGDFDLRQEDFVDSLRQALEMQSLDPERMWHVGVPFEETDDGDRIPAAMGDRCEIALTDGETVCIWRVDSLRALFRGEAQPPHLGDEPESYQGSFALFDLHALEISQVVGDRRDEELLEIYGMLRRRPDGRSLGFIHDFLWQAAALVLGTRPLSQAEFEAILSRLERSCRTFRMGPTSRNYIASMRQVYGGDQDVPEP